MSAIDSLPDPAVQDEPVAEPGTREPAWRLGAVAMTTVLAGYLLVTSLLAIVVSTGGAPGTAASTLLAAAVPAWLAAHQVPLTILGAPLSVLPFLPTVALAGLVAGISATFVRRRGLVDFSEVSRVVLAVGLAHAGLGAVIASLLGEVVDASVLDAFARCGLVAAGSAAVGVWRRGEFWEFSRDRPLVRVGLRGGLTAWSLIAAAGGLVVLLAVVLSIPRMGEMLARTTSGGDVFGLLVLSLLYLPNAVLAGWSFAAGPGITFGQVVARPFEAVPGPVPDVPLLAALPAGGAGWWWPLAFLLPVSAGAFVGWRCGAALGSWHHRLAAVALAALVAALGVLVAGYAAGGSAGGGPFDPITVHPVLLPLATFGWFFPSAAIATWFAPAPPVPEIAEVSEIPEVPEIAGLSEIAAESEAGSTGEDSAVVPDAAEDAEVEPSDVAEPDRPASAEATDLDGPDEELDEVDVDEAEWADLIRRVQLAAAPDPAADRQPDDPDEPRR